MSNNYKILKQLIDLWESYENIGERLNLSDFADWVKIQVKQNPELNIRAIHKSMKMENNGYGLYIENLDEPTRM